MLGLIDAGKHVDKYVAFTPVDGYYFGDGAITMVAYSLLLGVGGRAG